MSRIGQMSGERTDARKADGRSERQTDGEDQQSWRPVGLRLGVLPGKKIASTLIHRRLGDGEEIQAWWSVV
jgi:hypothetical protein